MTRPSAWTLALLAAGSIMASACAAKNASPPPAADALPGDAATDDAGLAPSMTEASPSLEGGADVPPALVRIAHVSPDLPAIDICVAPHATSAFAGPLLAGMSADAGVDSGASGLVFTQVSAYVSIAPGPTDVRIVPAGAADCAASNSLADATNLTPLAYNTSSTLLVAGDVTPAGADPGLILVLVSDDAVLAGGAAELRAINAVPSAPSLDFGFGSFETVWLPLLTGVAFASASAQTGPGEDPVDANGYVPIEPLLAQVISARASTGATSDTAVAADVAIPAGSIATAIAVGGKTGDALHPPVLLICMDNQPSGGLLADCSIASTTVAEGPAQ
jgi:hypothetical protein